MHIRHMIRLLSKILLWIILIVLIGVTYYEHTKITELQQKAEALSTELASTTAALSWNTYQLSQNITDLRTATLGLSNTLAYTQQNIDAVKNQVGGVEQTVGVIGGAVGNLQKLASVDPVLLKKYSKVYFMNENYVPAHLTTIPTEFTFSSTRQEQFLSEADPYLLNLLSYAKASGVTLYVKSGYRSFAEQKSLKSAYSVTYGAGTASTFSADQGYSEHQLGTTVDFITVGQNGQLTGFDKTPAYQWLSDNAFRYGFVLSYPKGNKYYVYEPWHWRFVGVKLATYLHENKIQFYDLDQREIDKYLATTFD
jgi:LAS superfamily LD-carboxypeptidase LdcB